jgi:thioredoxin-like negative regulator of GroEL
MDAKKLALTVPMDAEGKASEAYLVQGIPTTIVVDREGKVSEAFVGLPNPMTKIDQAIDQELDKATK